MRDRHWYKEAVLYELDVEVFQDSNGDGVGDFPGLTSRLDYLADLGVSCLWLNPFYPSPMRDNGYDVIDFCGVYEPYGSRRDFEHFLQEAAKRKLRVVVDLPLNHTSNQHRWFQEARKGPDNPYYDYYVWRKERPQGEEREASFGGSPWKYDEQAGAYYYHSFYDFQPDLNVANPRVREEFRNILRFWLDHDIDGFRMDAVPFLIHQEGIDAPFSVLQELHRFMISRRPDAVLIGEVNTPPETLDEYFGLDEDSVQLNMILNFYLCGHLWLALARGRGGAIKRSFDELPTTPPFGQWANFLRNHDELALDRLSEDEQQDVFRAFAPQEHMRAYGRGSRRRTAPMLGGDQQRLKLAHSVALTLPGTPVVYYGDEIGMGDDLSLKERNSVRTPMQWNAEPGGGFSSAPRERMVRPVIQDGEYGYPNVNVARQQQDPQSLLCFVKRAVRAHRDLPELGRGHGTFIDVGDRHVLAHSCEFEGSALWALHNLTDQPREVTLPLPTPPEEILSEGASWQPDGHVRLERYGLLWLRTKGAAQ